MGLPQEILPQNITKRGLFNHNSSSADITRCVDNPGEQLLLSYAGRVRLIGSRADVSETIGQRIKKGRIDAGMTQPELAKACGWASQGRVSNYERDLREPKSGDIALLAKALGVDESWLWTGNERQLSPKTAPDGSPHEDDYALIPQYTARGSAGNGHMNDHVEVKAGLVFKRDWISRMGLKEKHLRVIYADGDSMQPYIFDGDVVLLDCSETDAKSGEAYAIRRPDGEISIKRLFQRMSGEWVISSDNQDKARFPDEKVDEATAASAKMIVGHVVWRGGAV